MVKAFVQNVVTNRFIFFGLISIISKDNTHKISNLEILFCKIRNAAFLNIDTLKCIKKNRF